MLHLHPQLLTAGHAVTPEERREEWDMLKNQIAVRFSSISFPLTSSAPSTRACPLWICACGGRGAQSLSLSHKHTHTHTHHNTHTHTHTHTYTHTHPITYAHTGTRELSCISSSVVATDSYKRRQPCSCEICRYNSTSHGCVPSVPVT